MSLYVYLFIIYSVYWISCHLLIDQILPKLPEPHERLSWPALGNKIKYVQYKSYETCSVCVCIPLFQKSALYLIFFMFHSFITLAYAEWGDSLLFSRASSIPLCYVLFPATLLHQLFLHPLSPHLAIYLLVYLWNLLFPNSYKIPFGKFYFIPFSVHAQTNVIYLTLLSLL